MGFFKKIIRKVTKPVSKVLDKIVPNEIKPLLPYAAAFAPMLAPSMFAGASSGLGSLFKLGKFGGGALLGGGLSSLAQLAQEGNEGDLNLLSTGLGALSGGLSQAPTGMFTDMRTPTGNFKSAADAVVRPEVSILDKVKNVGLDTLEKGSGILKAGAADPFSMEGLKAATIPFSLATGDAMAAESNLAMQEYERALAEYNEQQGALGTDAGRREAILAAMRAYNHPEELIESTLAELGLRNGGRVAYNMGGLMKAKRGLVNEPGGYAGFKLNDFALDEDLFNMSGIKRYYLKDMSDDGETYDADTVRDMIYGGQYASGGRVGLAFGGIPAAVQNVKDKQLTTNLETAQDMQIPMEELVQEFIELKGRKPNDYDELLDYYRQKYGTGSQISSMTEKMTEEFAADGGMMGRKPFVSGGIGKGIMKMFSRGDDAVDLVKQKEVFRDGPITADFLQTVDKSIIDPAIRTRDTMGPGGYGMYNNLAEMPAGLQAAELISRIRKPGGGIDYEKAELFIGKKLRGNETIDELIAMIVKPQRVQKAADGGIMKYNMGGSVLPDGIEMDYRGGGFIPMGSKERADDVPARVSKNEFVMTADAVRAAGGGSVNEGAKKMYELMNNLEARA